MDLGVPYKQWDNVKLPAAVDWRAKGAVTPIKNQGNCRSCWAFASVGALEGQQFRKTKRLVSLSEQNLIDCAVEYPNNGCIRGNIYKAYEYVHDNGGLDTEDSYPYLGFTMTCRYQAQNSGVTSQGYVYIPTGDERKLQAAVATVGPIAVIIDSSHRTFGLYNGGLHYDRDCSSNSPTHGVLIVGYGTNAKGQDYWLVKNSWGANWGENGYIRMARNRNNNCGIASRASYPIV